MEWAKEKTQAAADTVRDTANNVLESGPVQQAEETAESAYETAADYIPGTEKSTTASIINTAPFSSFKPDPGNVWKGYVIYLSLALGCTLPWWAFVVAADYFNFRYHDHHMLRLFPLAYYAPWLLIYILFSAFGRQYTSWGRINLGLGISLVSLIAMPIIEGVFIKGQHGTTATFWVTLALVALAGAGDSIAQGSLVGIASELPERFTHAYVMGISVAGRYEKERMDIIDDRNHMLVSTVVTEGMDNKYNEYRKTVVLSPARNGATTIACWRAEFAPVPGSAPSGVAQDNALSFFKALEAYLSRTKNPYA